MKKKINNAIYENSMFFQLYSQAKPVIIIPVPDRDAIGGHFQDGDLAWPLRQARNICFNMSDWRVISNLEFRTIFFLIFPKRIFGVVARFKNPFDVLIVDCSNCLQGAEEIAWK